MTFTTNSDDGQALAYVVTPHAYKVTPTSDARRRIEAAGEAFQRQKKTARMEAEAEKTRIIQRRRKAVERYEVTKRDWLKLDTPTRNLCRDANVITIAEIADEVAKEYDISIRELKSDRRSRDVVIPRHKAMWRAYMETGRTMPDIGRFFGDRDHTSVLHAVRMHAKRNGVCSERDTTPKMTIESCFLAFSNRYGLKKGVSSLEYHVDMRPILYAFCWHCIDQGNPRIKISEFLGLAYSKIRNGTESYERYLEKGGEEIPIPIIDDGTAL